MSIVEEFFLELDAGWPDDGARHQLRIIGSTALMLQTNYGRGTNDSDIFETQQLAPHVKQLLSDRAGRHSSIHLRRRMYVDIVPSGIPFLPLSPRWHAVVGLNQQLKHFEVHVLDVVDVVVFKLKPFRPADVTDIAAMVERALVPHAELIERFDSAVHELSHTAFADDLPQIVRNLHQIERDQLHVAETEIQLPSWV